MENNTLDLTLYTDRWIAIVQGQVTGVASSRNQAYRAAKRMRPKDKAQLIFVDSKGQPLTTEQTWINKHTLLQQTVEILQTQQIEAYLVGGAVRDLLLEREQIVDLDFAVPGDGLTIARRVANALKAAFYPLDSGRGTGRVVCEMDTPSGLTQFYLDFASYRGSTLYADLADRDFTINAIALSLTTPPQLIDPLRGQQDLEQGQIRATSKIVFENDPLRVLRAIRQAAGFDFLITESTAQYLSQAASQLKRVSRERQRDELYKLLNTPAPGRAVRMLHRLGVLPYILPEVAAMVGVEQSPPHYLDVFEHTATALDRWAEMQQQGWKNISDTLPPHVEPYLKQMLAGNISQKGLLPLALLLHDTGKPLTRTETVVNDQLKVRFLGHEQESAKITRRVMRRLHFSSQAISFTEAIVAHHMRPLLLTRAQQVSRKAIYRLFRATGGSNYQAGVAVALHALADHRATYPTGQGQTKEQALLEVVHQLITAYFEQHQQLVNPPLLLGGQDLIDIFNLQPGQLIGVLLKRLKEAQAIGQIQDKEAALAFIKADPDFACYQAEEL